MSGKTIFFWILRLVAAFILLSTLFFKFSAAEESVYIFSKIGMEPWGRIGSGVVELIAAVLILIPRTTALGSLLTLGTMTGAMFFHLTTLGIVVMNDGGQLFYMAAIVWVCALVLLIAYRHQLLQYIRTTKS